MKVDSGQWPGRAVEGARGAPAMAPQYFCTAPPQNPEQVVNNFCLPRPSLQELVQCPNYPRKLWISVCPLPHLKILPPTLPMAMARERSINLDRMDFYYHDLMKYILRHIFRRPSPKYLLSKCPLLFFPPS